MKREVKIRLNLSLVCARWMLHFDSSLGICGKKGTVDKLIRVVYYSETVEVTLFSSTSMKESAKRNTVGGFEFPWENSPLSRGSRPWVLSGSPSCGARLAIVSLPCCSSYDAPSICHPSSHPERTAATVNGSEREREYKNVRIQLCREKRIVRDANSNLSGKQRYEQRNNSAPMEAHLFPRFLDHRLRFELLVGEGPGTWIEVSPRWGHRERYKRQAILYSWRVLGIYRAEEEQSTMSTLVYICFRVLDKHVIAIQILR